MKKIKINLVGAALGFSAFLYMSPSMVQAEGNPLTTLTEDVDIEILNENESDANILDVKLDNAPNGEDIQLQVSLDKESEDAVANVDLENVVVEDVVVEVLPSKTENAEQSSSTEEAVANVELEETIVDEIDIEVLPNKSTTTEDSTYEEEAVANVELTETIVDEIGVEVLPNKSTTTEDSTYEVEVVANVELAETIVDEIDIEILPNKSATTEDSTYEEEAVANVELAETIVDEIDVEVLPNKSANKYGATYEEKALIESTTGDLPILGDAHIGVLDDHFFSDPNEQSSNEGVAQINLVNGYLNEDAEVDVLVRNTVITKEGTYNQQSGLSLGVLDSILGSPSVDVLAFETFIPVIVPDEVPETSDPEGETPTPGTDMPDSEGETPIPGNDMPEKEGETPIPGNDMPDTEGDSTTPDTHDRSGVESSGRNSGGTTIALNNNSTAETSLFHSNFFRQNDEVLPKTGGLFDGMLISIIALLMFIGGVIIRKSPSRMSRSSH